MTEALEQAIGNIGVSGVATGGIPESRQRMCGFRKGGSTIEVISEAAFEHASTARPFRGRVKRPSAR